MSDRVWHSGPPPHVGWWNASCDRRANIWRWFDGKDFSIAYSESSSLEEISAPVILHGIPVNVLEWSDYWPENARVPRIDPRESEASKVAYVERFNFEVRLIEDRPWWKFWGKK